MSDESDKSFIERVEEIREERKKKRSSDTDENVREVMESEEKIAIVLGSLFIIGGIIGAIANPTEPVSGFVGGGLLFAGIGWLVGTKSGRGFIEKVSESMDQQQQQQQVPSESSEPKRICPECGWQNPKVNKFCHDCGSKLRAGND